MSAQQATRQELPIEKTWDLTSIFADDNAWEQAFSKLAGAEAPLCALKGSLTASAANLANVLQSRDHLERLLETLYVYAHLKSDEDTRNSFYSGMQDRIRSRWSQFSAALAWIEPEILAEEQDKLEALIAEEEMKPFRRLMALLLRDKPHTLSAAEERLMAMVAEPLGAAQNAFSKLNNADLRFPDVNDEKGQPATLTHGSFLRFLESSDRRVRRDAFCAIYDTYDSVKNTLAATLDGHVRKHIFTARARNFDSALEASLQHDQVEPTLYRSLVTAIDKGLPVFHDYLALRRDALGIDELDMYDLHVPIIQDVHMKVPYEEACSWLLEAFQPLGDDYVRVVEKGLTERWVDVLDCQGKRSGAYSSGCYDTNPYILMNYQDNLNSAFTLAHEIGHSLHSYFSNASQPHLYASYSIVVAEVASITNEALLLDYLRRKKKDDKRLQAYLLSHLCDDFRTTMYRQTMFAEFELLIHEKAEQGIPLTTDELNNSYFELNKRFHGTIQPDRRIALEWSRIPHFYYNFYVYKYATGFAAAQAFAERLLGGGRDEVDAYHGFLKSGCSADPLDILATAGVDLRDPAVIDSAIDRFRGSVADLGALLPTLKSGTKT